MPLTKKKKCTSKVLAMTTCIAHFITTEKIRRKSENECVKISKSAPFAQFGPFFKKRKKMTLKYSKPGLVSVIHQHGGSASFFPWLKRNGEFLADSTFFSRPPDPKFGISFENEEKRCKTASFCEQGIQAQVVDPSTSSFETQKTCFEKNGANRANF